MPVLYIANKNYSSWSLRPWLLLSELGIAFEEKAVAFGPGSNWEAFREFSPSGRVPCLRDGDTVVWDSLAIVEYLAERHPGVWPADNAARTWARCASAEMHSGFAALRNQCGMSCGMRVRLRGIDAALRSDIARINELWLQGLQRFGGPFLAGPAFTAVDAFFAPVVFRVQTYGIELDRPAADYARRMLALPSMRRWYEAALAESWRDEAHEEEIRGHGDVLEDLRVA
ncbi:glutathione S-transferase family protein [Dyella soli]|uniref:Glutathione S-transferase family protein n=1 Tax=Dyella soli TaxID=522319 RepID=A0A4R0YQP7_9GAMM|nr:glutathione S-transferase family protein [Dyella soli]TCI08890.1 glutathione S-transferase family protein [Dyella soli]